MTNSYIKGCDLSVVQGVLNFNSIKASGIEFIINRCYVGNNTNGTDIYYNKNIASAVAAGLYVGCYNFPFPLPYTSNNDTHSPMWQAQTHFKAAGTTENLTHCIDIEWPVSTDWNKWQVSANSINDWLFQYLEIYQGLLGKPPVIYSYPNYLQTLGNPSGYSAYPLWIASYAPTPTIPKPFSDFVLWQYSGGTDKLYNGVPADMDYAKSLDLWGVSSTPPALSPSVPNIVSSPVAVPPPPAVASPPDPVSAPTNAPLATSPATPAPTPSSNIFSALIAWLTKLFNKS
jgi:GH25 family lysozyme M1 (1,4-beta-N-acetylmuramidase)